MKDTETIYNIVQKSVADGYEEAKRIQIIKLFL